MTLKGQKQSSPSQLFDKNQEALLPGPHKPKLKQIIGDGIWVAGLCI
jgi:hypothetical protein